MKGTTIRRRFQHDGTTGWAYFFVMFGLALFLSFLIQVIAIKDASPIDVVVLLLAAIIIETAGIMMQRRSRAKRRMVRELRETGERVVAAITDCVYTGVQVGGSGHGHDGTALHRLLCSCTVNGTPCQFKSSSLHGNPMQYLLDNRVIVYYDRNDTSRYFVDVDESIAEFYAPHSEAEDSIPVKWKLPLLVTLLAVPIRLIAGSPISSIMDILLLPFLFMFIAWLCNARWGLRENRHPFFLHLILAIGIAVVSYVFPTVWRESTGYFAAAFLAFATLPVTLIASFCSQESRKRRRCTVQTMAVVVGHRQESLHASVTYLPIFSYDAAGVTREVVYDTGLARPLKDHDMVEILYNEKIPEEFCFLDKALEPSSKTAWVMVCGIAFVLSVILLVMMMS